MKKKKLIILCILLLIQILVIQGISFAAKDNKKEKSDISLSKIDEIFYLINNEYYQNVNQVALINGSMKSLGKFLNDKGLNNKLTEIPKTGDIDEKMYTYRKNLFNLVKNYEGKIDKNLIIRTAINGMVESLKDPYTVYFDREEYERFNSSLSGGDFCGIGIYLKQDKDTKNLLTIVETIKNTPAEKAGIKAKDIILEIDGISTAGLSMEEALKLLEGPKGSIVKLIIKRDTSPKNIKFQIKRDMIHISSVETKLLDKKIGYIKLSVFGKNTSDELEEALKEMEKKGAEKYILDLRDNGGGYVAAAIDVCSKFMPSNSTVVYIKGKNNESSYTSYGSNHKTLPLVVLVNEYSASASEITAGALQDSKTATLIGTKTFGKGVVQTIYELDQNEGAVKITTAQYLTPNKRNINKKGLEPDIKVEMDESKIAEDDIQLKKAEEYLNR